MTSKKDFENVFDNVAQWPIPIEEHFIYLLHEAIEKGSQTSTLDKNEWAAIEKALFSKFGKRYNREKLKAKYNRLRKIHREFAKLVAYTGMSLDPNNNTVQASEEVWTAYIKKNKFASRFRKKGCPHYHLLSEIFNNTAATGQMHYASTHSPPNSNDERDLETESGTKAYSEGHEGTSNTHKRSPLIPSVDLHSKSKTSKLAKMDDALEVWTKSGSGKTETSLAKIKSKKNKEVSSPFRELGSIEDCMEVLEAMEGVNDVAYVRACEKFTSLDWRRMFMKMSDARKRAWLHSLK